MTKFYKSISIGSIAMIITVTAALITIKGCWKGAPNEYLLYAGDTIDVKGISYTLSIQDSAILILDYDRRTNLPSEEIKLNNKRGTKNYYFKKKKFRSTFEYDSIRRELRIEVSNAIAT